MKSRGLCKLDQLQRLFISPPEALESVGLHRVTFCAMRLGQGEGIMRIIWVTIVPLRGPQKKQKH